MIDPTKVTRTALQNAASIAALLLTTEALVSEIKEEEKTPPMPPGGGGWGCTRPKDCWDVLRGAQLISCPSRIFGRQ